MTNHNGTRSHTDGCSAFQKVFQTSCFVFLTLKMMERIADALETLPERERELIIRRYYYGEKLKDIAERFAVSKTYIYALREAALAKLKKYFEILWKNPYFFV